MDLVFTDQSPVLGKIDSSSAGHHSLLVIFAAIAVFFALFYFVKRQLFADPNRAEINKLNANVQ